MKNIKKKLLCCVLSAIIGLQCFGNIFVHAADMVDIEDKTLIASLFVADSSNLSEYDKYIKVENNEFVLDSNANIASNIQKKIKEQISVTNNCIKKEGLVIDPQTKKAVKFGSQENGEGVTKIEFDWNYARVYFSATCCKAIVASLCGGVAVVAAVVMSSLGISSDIANGIATVITTFMGTIFTEHIHDGIWFDCNYVLLIFCGNWGLQ